MTRASRARGDRLGRLRSALIIAACAPPRYGSVAIRHCPEFGAMAHRHGFDRAVVGMTFDRFHRP
jgi:hypothetical protein